MEQKTEMANMPVYLPICTYTVGVYGVLDIAIITRSRIPVGMSSLSQPLWNLLPTSAQRARAQKQIMYLVNIESSGTVKAISLFSHAVNL